MKIRFASILAAVLAFAACSQNVNSDKTHLTCYLDGDGDQVRIFCADVDTLIYPQNGVVSLDLPVSKYEVSSAVMYKGAVGFVSDGTDLTIDFREEVPFAVPASKRGVAAAYYKFQQTSYKVQKEYTDAAHKIDVDIEDDFEKSQKMSELYDKVSSEIMDVSLAALRKNKDNAVAIVALNNIYNALDASELLDIIETLSPEVQASDFVSSLAVSLNASASTSEGKMFTDFTVMYDGNAQKLSDYVGKGKYVLVDFWASWCAPCRAEMPNLKEVYEKYHGDQFDMVSVAVWDENADTIRAAEELGITWNQIINGQEIPTSIYGIEGIPHIILFGPDGTILKRNLRGAEIGETVAKYVK